MARRIRVRRKGKGSMVFLLLFIIAAAGAGYIYTAPEFERIAPTIESPEHLFWNRKDPLKITLKDNSGLHSYKVTLSDGKNTVVVGNGIMEGDPKMKTLSVTYPTGKGLNPKSKSYTLNIAVTDKSLWHFFGGNTTARKIGLTIDYTRPNVNVIANSRMISQGGSALVVFQAEDNHLDKLYIQANTHTFAAEPYKKEGYYAALIAWPFTEDTFDAKIVATDKAGNRREVHIPFYHKNPHYRTTKIRATDKFIDGKITDLASSDPEYAQIKDRLEKLKAINETMRLKNEALIHKLSRHVSDEMIDAWHVKRFYPLKNGKKVASFGDHRYYYYKDKNNIVSESYHVGYDLASTRMADIVASNAGRVVFAEENGIYGNMPLIDHGLGLYTLYGHCSKLLVKEGDKVHAGEVIAKTGMTGLALGDHLHFGILVQGIEVRPIEWFDKHWIRKFIDNVFKEADRIIAPQQKSSQKNKMSKS